MGLLNDIKTNFNTEDLYKVLDCCKTANEQKLRKGYYKGSLKVHPDRVSPEEKEDATLKFQIIGKVFFILSDVDQRAVYDETGEIDEEKIPPYNWELYWRVFYKKMSIKEAKYFQEKDKESQEELDDLKQAYTDGQGDKDFLPENVLCASVDDEERLLRKQTKPKY